MDLPIYAEVLASQVVAFQVEVLEEIRLVALDEAISSEEAMI